MNESTASGDGVKCNNAALNVHVFLWLAEPNTDGFSDTPPTHANSETLLLSSFKEACIKEASHDGELLYWPSHDGDDDAPTPFASSFPEPPDYLVHSISSGHQSNDPENSPSESVDEEKGKGRAIIADSGVGWESDQETSIEESSEDYGGLTCAEKDEQSRRDAQMSLMLLAQELLEQGVPQEEIASYVYQTQLFAMSSPPRPAHKSPFQSPMSSSLMEEKLDLDRIAQLTIDGIATRPLPPAYGSNYTPEPSTSVAGSPILAVRRGSISSITSTISNSSTSGSSSYTTEEVEELVTKMQEFLDDCYEANKALILFDVDMLDRKRKRKQDKPSKESGSWRRWRHHLGLGYNSEHDGVTVAFGVEGNRIEGHINPRYGPTTPLTPSIPNDLWSVEQGGHDDGSAALTPQGPIPTTTSRRRRGSDQSPAGASTYFPPGEGEEEREQRAGARYQGF